MKSKLALRCSIAFALICFIGLLAVMFLIPDRPSSNAELDKEKAAKEWLSNPSNREAYREFNQNR